MSKSEEQEQDAPYKKKISYIAVFVIVLLCATLIFGVFKSPKKRSGDTQPLPIDQVKNPAGESEEDLQKRINEIRQKRQKQGPEPKQEPKQQVVQEDPPPEEGFFQQSKNPPKTVEELFKERERKRALAARQSGFSLKGSQLANRQNKEQVSTPAPAGRNMGLAPLLDEQDRVKQQIVRLERIQQPGNLKTPSLGFSQLQSNLGQNQQEKMIVGKPVSEGEPLPGQLLIPTGTMAHAVLDQKVMSDYVGPVRALFTHDVYDVAGNCVMIPKGARLTLKSLKISNINEPIQARMGLVANWAVLPNGKRISFEKRTSILDREGIAAVKDKVNYHFFAQFLGVAAYAVLAAETNRDGSGLNNDTDFQGDIGESLRKQFAPLAQKYLSLVPTITLNVGTPIKIFLEDDIYAYPWDSLSQSLYRTNRFSN